MTCSWARFQASFHPPPLKSNMGLLRRSAVTVTCQLSQDEDKSGITKYFKGKRWTNKGRVQLWTSTYRPTALPLHELLSTESTNSSSLAMITPITSIPSIASRPPRLSALSFAEQSRQSIAAAITLSSQAGPRASHGIGVSSHSAPSIQFVPVDRKGNLGALLEIPDSPCLVIFVEDMLLSVRGMNAVSLANGGNVP